MMGYTDLSEAEIGKVLQNISHEFVGTSYNLLTRQVFVERKGERSRSWLKLDIMAGIAIISLVNSAKDSLGSLHPDGSIERPS